MRRERVLVVDLEDHIRVGRLVIDELVVVDLAVRKGLRTGRRFRLLLSHRSSNGMSGDADLGQFSRRCHPMPKGAR